MPDTMLPSGTDTVELTRALVRCESVTPREAGALQLLEKVLTPLGFRCERMDFTEKGTDDVANLYARVGQDKNGNGRIDDIHGWDFDGNNNSIFDGSADDHGTHVSGTIGGVGGNGIGVAGLNWDVTLISAKFLGTAGGTNLGAAWQRPTAILNARFVRFNATVDF